MSHPPPPTTLKELLVRLPNPISELFNEPLPRNVGFLHTTGSMCAFMAVMQIVTGVLMAFYYTPSPDVAWESVTYVDTKVSFGRIIHGLHHWGSSAFVVLVCIHMIRVFTFAAYKGIRKWTWIVGVGLLAVVLGFGFTGYLLPWDMKAYFGTKVGTNIVGYAPIVGPYVRSFLLGGPEISELTLPRFYALHILVLPAALLSLMAAHLYLVRLFGITPPFLRDGEKAEYPDTFFPLQALRDSTMIFIVFSTILFLAWQLGGNLEEKADPLNTSYAPHPEWYFLGLQQLLRYFQGRYQIIGTVILPAGFFAGMILLPFLDRNPERALHRRPVALTLGMLVVLLVAGLTLQGYRHLQLERAELSKQAAAEQAQPTTQPAPAATPAEAAPISGTVAQATEFNDGEIQLGKKLYESLHCAGCHVGEKPGKDLNIPPAIDLAGDRFHPQWMIAYMKQVPPRRFEQKGRRSIERMPDFKLSESELRGITGYMMTLKRPDLFPPSGIDFTKPTPEKLKLGEELVANESCLQCHPMGSKGVKNAPDLAGVGGRLKPEFIFHIIKKPQSIVPGTTMDDSPLQDSEIEAITHYLMSVN